MILIIKFLLIGILNWIFYFFGNFSFFFKYK